MDFNSSERAMKSIQESFRDYFKDRLREKLQTTAREESEKIISETLLGINEMVHMELVRSTGSYPGIEVRVVFYGLEKFFGSKN